MPIIPRRRAAGKSATPGVVSPRQQKGGDRLVLGMKGILSEMELHIMKGSLERGRFNKAKRGELFHGVPRGYDRPADVGERLVDACRVLAAELT